MTHIGKCVCSLSTLRSLSRNSPIFTPTGNVIGVFGKGGFSREIKCHIQSKYQVEVQLISDQVDENDNEVIDIKNIDEEKYDILMTQGDPFLRSKLYDQYKHLNHISYIHDENCLLDTESIRIGNGSIVCAGSIVTTNVGFGLSNHINLNSTIGHDTNLGDFVTISPGVNVSGNCHIGNKVLIGTNSAIKEHISICDNVIIGMNSNVVKNIDEPGIYFGNPLKKLKNL